MIEYACTDGSKAAGYLASAERKGAPGVVVIQEWWGLQEQIKGICDELAAAGYNALAPDLYGGTVVPYHDPDAANREMSSLDFLGATDRAVRGAVQYLKRDGAKAGLTGFCMGGAVTVIGAVRIPELDAAVCFYGIPPEQAADPAAIRVPFQGHFANQDDWCTPQAVDGFEAKLKQAGISADIFRYDAEHGFMNEQREVHAAEAAAQAWERMLGFWKQHLG
ncbi:MAG: dienelactone hydrolase family protein [Burkholderiales bacterium]|nr:MAG: dienelactone hydrolase family protein [Burkholderiales bacterium]